MDSVSVVHIGDQFSIHALPGASSEPAHVLKHDETFAVVDNFGNLNTDERGEQGLFYQGTRFLKRYRLLIGEADLVVLGSEVNRDSSILSVNLTSPDLYRADERVLEQHMLHMVRAVRLRRRALVIRSNLTFWAGCMTRSSPPMP